MTLASTMRADVTSVFLKTDDFAESITYRPKGRPARTIKAVIAREEGLALQDFADGSASVRQAVLSIADDETNGVADPSVDDEVQFDGALWKVSGKPDDDGFGMLRVRVNWIKLFERTTPDYRITR